jgi:hypothetical protein
MALGCAFIFLCVLLCWRRHARKKRAKRTAQFASAKALDGRPNWRTRLARFFGHGAENVREPANEESEEIQLMKLRHAEEARHQVAMEKLMGSSYKAGARKPVPSLLEDLDSLGEGNRLSVGSLYSQMTGMPRRTPEPRLPVKSKVDLLSSRFSASTASLSAQSSQSSRSRELTPPVPPFPPTEAESYLQALKALEYDGTGTSRNPFRK